MSLTAQTALLVSPAETGRLNIMHLKRFWMKACLKRTSDISAAASHSEWQIDKILLSTLGLGLEQAMKYVYNAAPSFETFEDWIIETAGIPPVSKIDRFNKLINGDDVSEGPVPNVLTEKELDFFEANGYLVLKNVVSQADCDKSVDVICNYINVVRDNPATWYTGHTARQGIMVQLFQDGILEQNRQSSRLRQVFEQLYNRTDLWVSADRVGFNPPETERWKFPGPHLHWDVSLQLPIPFKLQGLLYLADTAENQGAFTLVPGFQHRISDWLAGLPAGVDPRRENLDALGSKPIAANAGDFVVWLQALPHGSRPNTASKPRFVQYITYEPADLDCAPKWI
ncbi:MAG: phytanoyl-CoA dioxygenase family protein [Mucilaginibacter sp.]